MKRLILNADDFGMTHGVNEGIIRAHREGILTSATLMADGEAFGDAVEKAKANKNLGIGCHLVLVGGKCVAPRELIASLADAEGNLPNSLAVFAAKVSAGIIRVDEIGIELRAQIEKIRAAGIALTHLDTHKHTHAHPRVMKALAKVANECGIRRVRKPIENLRDSWGTTRIDSHGTSGQIVAAGAVRAVASQFQAIAKKYGLLSPDYFLGLAMTGKLGPATLGLVISALEDGTTEIMLHPGVCDADLERSGSRLQHQREDEMAGLMDPLVHDTVTKLGIRLINYGELN